MSRCKSLGWALLGLGILMAGCQIRSVQPWFDEDTIVGDNRLQGVWTDAGAELTVSFLPGEKHVYHLLTTDKEGTDSHLRAALHTVTNQLFMAVGPEPAKDVSAYVQLPVYLLFKAQLTGDTLLLYPLNMDVCMNRYDARGLARMEEGSKSKGFLLTASTPELETFVAREFRQTADLFEAKPLYTLKRRNP